VQYVLLIQEFPMLSRCFSIGVLLSAAVVVSLCATSAFSAAPATQSTPSKLLDPKPTIDKLSGLQMNLPTGWTPKKGVHTTAFEAPVRDEADGKTLAANVSFMAADAKGIKPSNITDLLKQERAKDAQQIAGFKEVESAPAAKEIAGKGVGVIEYTATPQPNAKVHFRTVYIVAPDVIYLVTWTSLDGTYAKHQKQIDAAMDTLVIP
jgi:hypothetical protein